MERLPRVDVQAELKPVGGTGDSSLAEHAAHGRLPYPAGVQSRRVRWGYTISIVVMHGLALLALWPALFSWAGVVCCVVGLYVFGTLGVNLGFHRLLTHRSFKCPRWVERAVAILGVCCLQEGPARWVAIHRKHHQHSDEEPDPHSPLVAFVWGHCGWLMLENRDSDTFHLLQRYSRDLVTQPFYFKLERRLNWLWVYAAHALIIALAGLVAGLVLEPTFERALWLAASIVVWGVFVRTVVVWHITWSVNSLSHMWGYRTFTRTGENSRNNWFVALISNGEGWHNNHHGDQRSAAHGHRWWELDVTYLSIRALEMLGLAWDVVRPDRHSRTHTHAHADVGNSPRA